MKIEALCSINSGQADKGDVLDLPEDAAKALIAVGAAKKVIVGKASTKLVSPQEEKKKVAEEHKEKKGKATKDGGK